MQKEQTHYFYGALGCLAIGSVVYIVWRPDSLVMFRWFESMRLGRLIYSIRDIIRMPSGSFAKTFIFSAPFAFWVLSYLLCVKGIWYASSSPIRHFWFWLIPIVAIGAELLQYYSIVPGTFDIIDVCAITFAVSLVFSLPKVSGRILNINNRRFKNGSKKVRLCRY